MEPATAAVLPAALADLRSLAYYGTLYGVLVAVAAWIYRDARKRGRRPRRAVAWAGATLVFSILTVLLYLYLRERSATAARRDQGSGSATGSEPGTGSPAAGPRSGSGSRGDPTSARDGEADGEGNHTGDGDRGA